MRDWLVVLLFVWMAAASVCTCAMPSSMVYLSKNSLNWVWEQLLHVEKAQNQISVGPALCWGPQRHAVCEALPCSQNWLKCPLSMVLRCLVYAGPECLGTCQVSCRLGGRSSCFISFLHIKGVTTYFVQGCTGSFCGRARRSRHSNPWSSLYMVTLTV